MQPQERYGRPSPAPTKRSRWCTYVAVIDGPRNALPAPAWPVLLSRLLIINANGYDAVRALVDFASAEGVEDAHDPAAVIDHHLDIVGLREAPERRPLPWLPAVPEKLASDPEWRTYRGARFELVTRLAR